MSGDWANAVGALDSLPVQERADVKQLRAQIDEARLRAGLDLIRQDHFREAVDLLATGANGVSAMPGLLSALGLAQFRVGRYCEAIQTYSRALDVDPHFDTAREGLAFLL